MPIRADLRHHYSGPAWQATRRAILERAGGRFDENGRYVDGARCEDCGAPHRKVVLRAYGWWAEADLAATCFKMGGRLYGQTQFYLLWHHAGAESRRACFLRDPCHWVSIVVVVAHLNHVAGDDRPENLKAFCQWCHLNHDKPQHKNTRSERKDAVRPLLQEASI